MFWIAKSQNRIDPNLSEISGYCVYLFLKSLRSYVEKFLPNTIYIAWDKKQLWPSTNFRKQLLEGSYKGTRDKSQSDSVYKHEDIIEKICGSLGVRNMFPYVLEADDVISWLSVQVRPNIIISVDNDLLQLVDRNNSFYHLNKKVVINPDNFEEHTSVALDSFLYYKAILGDISDNITGFPGYGKVRSKKLANQLSDVAGDIHKLNLTEEYTQLLARNLKLIDLKYGWDTTENEADHYKNQLSHPTTSNFDQFECLCRELDLKKILSEIEDWKAIFTINNGEHSVIDMLK